ncbi:NAD(P)/FAD-dependent oxidoreductase [Microbacterium sp. A196]|uniref:NAD(P)/FAD-dependent oxidoreductase n=1 Tax=Microbacterium sp. A196 TaxID=3457320 RepID=UPI003FD0EF96
MSAREAIIIVGASAAGLAAADGLREGGYEGPITVVDTENRPSYDRPMLSKGLVASKDGAEPTLLRTAEHYEKLGIEVLAGHGAVGIDVDRHLLVTDWGEALPWSQVIIATGVEARVLTTSDGQRVPTLRDRADLAVVRQIVDSGKGVTLLGGGFIGMEVASALRSRDIPVTVVDRCDLPLSRVLGNTLAKWLLDLHIADGVKFELGVPATRIDKAPHGFDIHRDGGSTLTAEQLIGSAGSQPRTQWLLGSGIELDEGVVVDAAGRTNIPSVWAAGDVASTFDAHYGRYRRFEHWTHAIEHGRHVGLNAARGTSDEFAAVPYIWTEQVGRTLHILGEPRAGDEDQIIEGDLASGEFVIAHGSDGELRGVTICGRVTSLRTYKKLLRAGASLQDALAAAN